MEFPHRYGTAETPAYVLWRLLRALLALVPLSAQYKQRVRFALLFSFHCLCSN